MSLAQRVRLASGNPGRKGERAYALTLPFCLFLSFASHIFAQQPPSKQTAKPNPSKAKPRVESGPYGVIHSQRYNSGVTLGGIGCGTFQLMTDGAISRATINNNWNQPTGDMKGCFAAVWTSGGGRTDLRSLTLKNEYGLPNVAGIDYLGMFPQAFIQYPDTALPVSVSLRAYSSLVPQDLMSSTLPAALFTFTVKNTALGPVDASIAMSWENFLGVGGTASKGAFSDRTGNKIAVLPQSEGVFGLRMTGPESPAKAPDTRFYYNAQGTYALLAQPVTPDTVVSTATWNALDRSPGWWQQFSKDGTVTGSVAAGKEGSIHPAGVIALKVSLKAGEVREIPFVVSWFTPRLYTSEGDEYGHYYQKLFKDAYGVGKFAIQNRLSLAALTDEWQNRLVRSTLPPWLIHRLINDASVLFTNSIYTRDSALTEPKAGPALFTMLERTGGNGDLGAVNHRIYAHPLLAAFFPHQNLRELEQFASAQTSKGEIPRNDGNLDVRIAPVTVVDTPDEGSDKVGPSCAFAIQVAQYYAWTGDQRFLDRFYPAAKHAIEFAASVPIKTEGPDRHFAQIVYYRAALRAGERMAESMRDKRFADTCRDGLGSIKALDIPSISFLESWFAFTTGAGEVQLLPPAFNQADLNRFSRTSPGRMVTPLLTLATANLVQQGDMETAMLILHQLERERKVVEESSEPGPNTADELAGMPASWYLLKAFAGCDFDFGIGRLTLTPPMPKGSRNLTVPIFTPTFWATESYTVAATRGQLQFRIDRWLPVTSPFSMAKDKKSGGSESQRERPAAGLTIKEIVLPAPPNPSLQLTVSLARSPVTGKSALDGKGHVVFTPDAPLLLTTGQRLEFLFRP